MNQAMDHPEEYSIRKLVREDWDRVIEIFNYYVENSFAAYPDQPVDLQWIKMNPAVTSGYPFLIVESAASVIGFGFLSPFLPISTTQQTGMLTYFIDEKFTGKGIGSDLLNRLMFEGKGYGINNFIVHLSSRNPKSLHFHLKHGFEISGRLNYVGNKHNKTFDIIWMQRNEVQRGSS